MVIKKNKTPFPDLPPDDDDYGSSGQKQSSSMETIRNVLAVIQSISKENMGSMPEITKGLLELDNIMPKIVVGGDQNVGKSSLLNKLMPPILQEEVKLPVEEGTCTRSVTTIQFVHHEEKKIELTCRGETESLPFDDSFRISEKMKHYQQREGKHQKFFQFEVLVKIMHPDIKVGYALVDMPGLRNADAHSHEIENQLNKLKRESNMLLAVGKAEDDPDTLTVLRNLNENSRNICVLTKADGITNWEAIPTRIKKLENNHNVYKWAITSAKLKREIKFLNENLTIPKHQTSRTLIGTESLRQEIEDFYQTLVNQKFPVALDIAKRLEQHLAKRIHTLDIVVNSPDHAGRIITDLWLNIKGQFEQQSEFHQVSSQAHGAVEEKLHAGIIGKFFENNKDVIKKIIMQNPSKTEGRVRGTEGIYGYLRGFYKIFGGNLVRKCTLLVQDQQKKMKDIAMALIQSEANQVPAFQKAAEEFIKSISNISDDPTEHLHKKLVIEDPHSSKPYSHNAAASIVLDELTQVTRDLERKENSEQEKKAIIDNLRAISDKLLLMKSSSTEVTEYNVLNCVEWYWRDTYHSMLINEQKMMISTFWENIHNTLEDCLKRMMRKPEDFIVVPNKAQVKDLKTLKKAHKMLQDLTGQQRSDFTDDSMPYFENKLAPFDSNISLDMSFIEI